MKRTIASLVVTSGVLVACTAMSGLELQSTTDPTGEGTSGNTTSSSSGKTSSSGTTSSSSGDPNKCNPLKEPAKPAKSDEGGTNKTLVFAVKQLVENNSGQAFGLDLDGLCTCFVEKGQAAPGADACKRTTQACDAEQNTGLDNAGYVLFKQIVQQGGVNLITFENNRIIAGLSGIVLEIADYNGLANDDDVQVKLIRSAGIPERPDFTTKQDWPNSDTPRVATEAYVAGGTLVARFPTGVEVPFLISTAEPPLMTGAILTANIVDGAAIPEVMISGRTNTSSLINAVGQIRLGSNNLCDSIGSGITTYEDFAAAACQVSDMPTDPGKDRDPNTPCDAMSFGNKMLMVPAGLGPSKPFEPYIGTCNGVPGFPLACPNP